MKRILILIITLVFTVSCMSSHSGRFTDVTMYNNNPTDFTDLLPYNNFYINNIYDNVCLVTLWGPGWAGNKGQSLAVFTSLPSSLEVDSDDYYVYSIGRAFDTKTSEVVDIWYFARKSEYTQTQALAGTHHIPEIEQTILNIQ